jgi:hypothetical protein
MDNKAFILYLNDKIVGVYDNEKTMNIFIDGAVQNNFFSKENIKIEKFAINSCLNLSFKKELPVPVDEPSKKEIKKEMMKTDEFKEMMQEKTDLVNQINRIKYDKKLMIEKENLYKEDLKLYNAFITEKNQNSKFVIPELFTIKFNIFEKLNSNNTISFETFSEEYDKVKPANNYDMFKSNTYETSFEGKSNNFEMEFELQV